MQFLITTKTRKENRNGTPPRKENGNQNSQRSPQRRSMLLQSSNKDGKEI